MRDARVADWIRRLRAGQHEQQVKLSRFAVNCVPSIGSLEIPIQSAITVISGANGVGKTTLLRAMWAALDPESSTPAIISDKKLAGGSVLVELTVDGEQRAAEVKFSADGPEPVSLSAVTVHHIDSAASTPLHQKAFSGFSSVDEIVNGAGPRELDASLLAEVSYIVHRQYRAVTVYEVELDTQVPFFEVSYGDDRYDSRTMGAGELAALYIWWAVVRAESGSILLVEEPEAFLSSGSQKSLANFIIGRVVEQGLACIISSHSAAFISPMPKECLTFFARTPAGVRAIEDQPPPVVLKEMGIEPAVDVLIFVEDSLGRLLCRAILEKYDPLLSRQAYIEQRNGDGEVISALKPLVGMKAPIKFIGLFDGDLRGKVPKVVEPYCTFLPGAEPIEVVFRKVVESDPEGLEAQTGTKNCAAILGSLEGKDHHDWYEELGRELGLSRDQLFPHLFALWIRQADNEKAAIETFEALVALRG